LLPVDALFNRLGALCGSSAACAPGSEGFRSTADAQTAMA
jgi:hypothetical protein